MSDKDERVSKISVSPYPEFDGVIELLKRDEKLWANVLIDEKDTYHRLMRIEKLDGQEKEEEIYELESRSAGHIYSACLKCVEEFGVKDTIGTIAKLTVSIRYFAAHDLGI